MRPQYVTSARAGSLHSFFNKVPDIPGHSLEIDAAVASRWDVLADKTAAPPSQRRLWLEPWWESFGTGQVEIHTVERAGQITAILPVARRGADVESTANYHTPAYEILAEDEASALAVARRLFDSAPVHVSLTMLDQAGRTLRVCQQAALAAGYTVRIRPYIQSPYLQAEGGLHEFQSRLGGQLRRNIRRARRQLGPVTLETVTGGPDLDARLAEAFRIEASGWKGAEGTAIASRPHTRHFYAALAHRAATAGMLRLFLLKSGRRTVAVCFALQSRESCSLLKGGYDEQFERRSPSTLLTHDLIQECLGQGVRRIDFNGGTEPYKLLWANARDSYVRFEAFAPTLAGRMALASFTYVRPVTWRVNAALGLPQAGHRQ